jgi:hypothetical protein
MLLRSCQGGELVLARTSCPTAVLRAAAVLALGLVAACATSKSGSSAAKAAANPADTVAWTSTAPTKAWDQAAVTGLAEQLAKQTNEVWEQVLYLPNLGQVGSGDAADTSRLQYKTRRIREQAMALSGALQAGKSRQETLPQVEDLGEQADDLRIIVQRMFVQHPIQQKLAEARSTWWQMLPYYGIKPPPAIQLQ